MSVNLINKLRETIFLAMDDTEFKINPSNDIILECIHMYNDKLITASQLCNNFIRWFDYNKFNIDNYVLSLYSNVNFADIINSINNTIFNINYSLKRISYLSQINSALQSKDPKQLLLAAEIITNEFK